MRRKPEPFPAATCKNPRSMRESCMPRSVSQARNLGAQPWAHNLGMQLANPSVNLRINPQGLTASQNSHAINRERENYGQNE